MLRARLAALAAVSILLTAAPAASAADVILPFSNYKVGAPSRS
jgi:hypothetical protein